MEWISVDERLPNPGAKVIAYFKNEYRLHRRIMAMYAPTKTIEPDLDDEFCDYDEETDTYYLPCGWYERNEFDDNHYSVGGTVTHWMPLPKPPKKQ